MVLEGGGVQTKITVDEWPLIQPSQVHVEVPPVHTAESRLTPLGMLLGYSHFVLKLH
jgi:hypothetical protein